MILVTTEGITGKELEMLGLVNGSTIQTVNAVRDIGAGLKTLVGGLYPLYFFLHYAERGRSHCLWYRGQNYRRPGAEYSSAAGTPAV